MRKGERSRLTGQAWLFALGIPAVGLFLLFSLLPYGKMVGHWPLGIGQQEVMAYQQVFDHRPGQHPEGHAAAFNLRSREGGSLWLVTDSSEAQVTVEEGDAASGPFTLRYTDPKGHGGTFAIRFEPADLESLTSLYAYSVADSLPILAPRVELVEMTHNGRDQGPYLVTEVFDPLYMELHAPKGMSAWNGEADSEPALALGFPRDTIGDVARELTTARLDEASSAALGLLALATDRKTLLDGSSGVLANAVSGLLQPVFTLAGRAHAGAAEGNAANAFTRAMASGKVQASVGRLAAQLRQDSAAWAERLLTMDSAMVPVLAKGRHVGLMQAQVDRARDGFLQRLFAPDPRFAGTGSTAEEERPTVLDPWLAPYRTQADTIRFTRGKYVLDHDLVLPVGMALVLEKGTRWFMAPGVSVVVNGELHVRGTGLNPVFIRPLDPAAPYGSVAVNGTGNTRVRISGLQMSGGSGLVWQGVAHDAMLSFIGTDLELRQCAIGESLGAAALHVAAGKARIADTYVERVHGAFANLVQVEGDLRRCAFVRPVGTAGKQPGLALDASRMLVSGCTVSDVSGAAVSLAGQSEALLSQSRIKNSGVALELQQACAAWVEGTEVSGNNTAFRLRQGNPGMPGARLELAADNTLFGNATPREVQGDGQLVDDAVISPKVKDAFGLSVLP